jgi:hypothetical protein
MAERSPARRAIEPLDEPPNDVIEPVDRAGRAGSRILHEQALEASRGLANVLGHLLQHGGGRGDELLPEDGRDLRCLPQVSRNPILFSPSARWYLTSTADCGAPASRPREEIRRTIGSRWGRRRTNGREREELLHS